MYYKYLLLLVATLDFSYGQVCSEEKISQLDKVRDKADCKGLDLNSEKNDKKEKELDSRLYREKELYDYLKKNYLYVIKNFKEDKFFKRDPKYENKIWQLWLQKIENAPDIVKACAKSVKKYAGNREVILLNEDTISKYIELPDYIWEKYRSGVIKPAHFADIVRSALLYKYGGIWIDSTVLLEKEIPDRLTQNDLFMFQISKEKEVKRRRTNVFANWFMVAKPGNRFIKLSLDFQKEYWRHENSSRLYFLNYIMYKLIIDNDKLCFDLYKKMPYYPEILYLYDRLRRPWIKDIYECFMKADGHFGIHKLAYYRKLRRQPGTFYDYFCNLYGIPYTDQSR